MIIQFNLMMDERVRRLGHKLFYHWNDGTIPNNEQICEILHDRYLIDFTWAEATRHELLIYSYGRPFAEAFPIFCDYDHDGSISLNYIEYRHLNWNKGWFDHTPDRLRLG